MEAPMSTPAPAATPAPKLDTFGGVFTPTLLTILGVIMYLRLGWVVGNGGLIGALLVIGLAVGITAATGLSLSSIATNTRLGAGGPYAIISKSLGVEVGGSVGVPLFVSQALAVAMYIFGFREGVVWLLESMGLTLPPSVPLVIDLATFALVFTIAYVSAEFAFKVQYVIMAVIGVSLVLILGSSAGWDTSREILWVGDWRGSVEDGFAGTSFWVVFAVFFPAATGVMAGANMSGDLENPRRAIPWGTLSAIGLSTVVYVLLAVWLARAGTAEELTSNYTFLIDASLWGPGVLAGLLGATLSSALSSLVGAPRILIALVGDKVVPAVAGIEQLSDKGEPRRAMIASAALVLAALLLRDLNAIAPLLSMFFLITYFVINLVVLVESTLGLQSYRPTLRVPRVVPALGAVGCIFAMFIVNPTVSLVAVAVVVGLYGMILRRGVSSKDDSRSGIFSAVAEWAAARATEYEAVNPRAWKPNLLVPVQDTAELRGDFQLLNDLVRPEGTIKLLGVAAEADVPDVTARMNRLGKEFRSKGVFTTSSVLDSTDLTSGVVSGIQSLRSAFFRPNVLFLDLGSPGRDAELEQLWRETRRLKMGLAVLAEHPQAGLGRRSVVHLWFDPKLTALTPSEALYEGQMHLALLMALRLRKAWDAELRVFGLALEEEDRAEVQAWLAELFDLVRVPSGVVAEVVVGDLSTALRSAPQSDLDILGLPPVPSATALRRYVEESRSACVFFGDSGMESALS
jgi:amino acid transporter